MYRPGFEEYLQEIAPNNEVLKVSTNTLILFIKMGDKTLVSNIISSPLVISVVPMSFLDTLGKITQGTVGGVTANEEIGANFLKNNPYLNLSGRGVLIGIIDSGIDYLHPDFIYEDGTSKIVYLWDQTVDGNPPDGYSIGTEYTREQINEAIANNNSTLSVDDGGTGTMNAGICAGRGVVNSNYAGVAEDAELIVVKLRKVNNHYPDIMFYAGSSYVIDKAKNLNMPIVLSIGLGSNFLIGTYTRTILNPKFYSQGFCAVAGAGNEGNTETHTNGVLTHNGDQKFVDFEIDQPEKRLQIQIWIGRPDTVIVSVIAPSGEETKILEVSDFNMVSGLFDLEGTYYVISTIFPNDEDGQQLITISLTNVVSGNWRIKLTGVNIIHGYYYVYLPNRAFLNTGTRFVNPDTEFTITYPATQQDNITVGAYNTLTQSLWPGSSRGPTISNLDQPDLVAPGVNIIAPYPGGEYAMITGTTPAAAYTAGCVALFMQYILVDGHYPDKAFVQSIKTYFRLGATRESQIDYPNDILGYGFLNILNTFNKLR